MKRKLMAVLAIVSLCSGFGLTATAATKLRAITAPGIAADIAGGQLVTVTPAKWNQKVKVTYQWFADSIALKGATKSSLLVAEDLVGQQLKVRAIGKASSGKTATVYSNSVLVGDYSLTGQVVAAYRANSTDVLGVTQLPLPAFTTTQVSYQWYRGGIDIVDATAESYTLATLDHGRPISVRVDYKTPGRITKSLYSNEIAVPELALTYDLLWSDEFNGVGGADSKIWSPQEGDGVAYRNKGWGNKELQWYLGSQANQDGKGSLTIEATRSGADAYKCYYGTCSWLSSKLVTLGKVGFEYGRLEARIKAAPGEGTWGAFWTLGANIAERGWPGCGEIDITELLGRNPNTTLGYLHGPLSGGGGRGDRLDTGKDLTAGYHVYAVDWFPDQINWYIDGQLYSQVNKTDADWVFDHEQYLILNLAMGGTLGGTVADSVKSTSMSVDYVRYYSINGIGKVIQH